jgi:hypothetical protein
MCHSIVRPHVTTLIYDSLLSGPHKVQKFGNLLLGGNVGRIYGIVQRLKLWSVEVTRRNDITMSDMELFGNSTFESFEG